MCLAALDTDPPKRGPVSERVLLPVVIVIFVWLASYVLHEWYLASMHFGMPPLGGKWAIEGPFDWARVPRVLLPPDLGWLVLPALFVCLRRSSAQRARPVERALVAFAPVAALLVLSWRTFPDLGTDFLPVPGTLKKEFNEAWAWVFVARDSVSLICTGVMALFLESLARRDLRRQRG
jgi:hypothetical protein